MNQSIYNPYYLFKLNLLRIIDLKTNNKLLLVETYFVDDKKNIIILVKLLSKD